MANHSSILAWVILWTEDPDRLPLAHGVALSHTGLSNWTTIFLIYSKKRERDLFSNLWKMFKVYRETKIESEERKVVRLDWVMLKWDVKNSGLDSVGNRGSLRSTWPDLCLAVQSSEIHILHPGHQSQDESSGIFWHSVYVSVVHGPRGEEECYFLATLEIATVRK